MRPARPPRRPDPVRALLWVLAALLAAAVAGVAVYRAWPILFPVVAERAPLDPGCDLAASACTGTLPSGGRITLDVQPRGIPPLRPLTLAVRLAGLAPPQRVEVDLAGVDMDMGFNRAVLSPVESEAPNDGSPGLAYTGTATLPVCVRSRMTWEARVLLFYPQRILAAPFRFDSVRDGV